MTTTEILPNIGTPVSVPGFDENAIDSWSIGQHHYATTVLLKRLAKRLADPATAHEFATYAVGIGADWGALDISPVSGHEDECDEDSPVDQVVDAEPSDDVEQKKCLIVPSPPENYYDSLPAIAVMLHQMQNAQDALMTYFAGHLEPALENQSRYFGVPVGVKGFRDSATYFREVLKFSRQKTTKIHDRKPYLTWTSGQDPQKASYRPRFLQLATAYADSTIPSENIDRIMSMDKDLTKYAHKTGHHRDYKDDILQAFEPTLVEAAQNATPDELSQAKQRWLDKIAHAIDPDGPPVSEAVRKQADNAIHTQNMPDGSGKISMHATPDVYAVFKNFSLHQLNDNGTPVKIPQDLLDKLFVDRDDEAEQPDLGSAVHDINDVTLETSEEATAEDAEGHRMDAEELATLDAMTPGQRLGAITIGMFLNLLSMDPAEIGMKKAHGAAAQLVIVQDLQTAYRTLGVGALPEDIRRRPGPAGILPPILRRQNPDDPSVPQCSDPSHTLGYSPPPWTGFMSEAVNYGPLHPRYAERLCCDSELVGQIWNQDHTVLAQHRTHRLFDRHQRRAVLARDRGCQAPGCTIPAAYSQIHHIIEWQDGGETNIDNAMTLCAHHHAAVHNGKWAIRRHHGICFFQPAPWLDPRQPLLRNVYWNA